MNETILNGKSTVEINALDKVSKENIEHSIKFAWSYAKEGRVDYVRECLDKGEKDAMKIGQHIDEKLKNDILRTALKKGVKKQLEYVKVYANEKDLRKRDSCLNSAEEFTREILNYQRSVKEIKSNIGNKLLYRRWYGKVSEDELQKRFDRTRWKYDIRTIKEQEKLKKQVEKTKNELLSSKYSRFESIKRLHPA